MCADEVFRGQEQSSGAGRAVSAADVVLYGVNIVLPLMSQDLLKVKFDFQPVRCSLQTQMFEVKGALLF